MYRKELSGMAKATTTMRQVLNYQAEHGVWFAANYAPAFDPGNLSCCHCLSSIGESEQRLATTMGAYFSSRRTLLALHRHTVCLPTKLFRSSSTPVRSYGIVPLALNNRHSSLLVSSWKHVRAFAGSTPLEQDVRDSEDTSKAVRKG